MELRGIDGKIAAIRHETDFYRRMGFGRDYKDIQMMTLEEERAKTEARLHALEREARQSRSKKRKQPLFSWFLLPVLFLLMGIDAVAPKRRSPRERFLETRWRPQPRVSFDLG